MAVVLALVTGACFGGVLVSVRLATTRRAADPAVGALVAAAVASMLVFTVALVDGVALADLAPSEIWPFLVIGAVSPGASHSSFYPAIRSIGSSRAGIFTGTSPMLAAALAIVLLDEPLRVGVTIGMLLIVGGGIVLAHERHRPADFRPVGVALALLTALFFALRDVLARSVTTSAHATEPALSAAVALFAGTVVLAVILPTLLARGDFVLRLQRTWIPFIPTGILTGVGWITLFNAIERAEVTVVSPLFSTQTGWTVLFGALLIGRSEAGPRVLVAAPLIMAGSALIGVTR